MTRRGRSFRPFRASGFTVIELLIVLGLLAVIVAISTPHLMNKRKYPYESRAIGALKTIATSEAIFREGDKENDKVLDYAMLSELGATNLIEGVLASGEREGYLFAASYSFTTSEFLWFATANPRTPGTTGDRYFATNQAGVIFYTTGAAVSLDTSTCSLPNHGVRMVGK